MKGAYHNAAAGLRYWSSSMLFPVFFDPLNRKVHQLTLLHDFQFRSADFCFTDSMYRFKGCADLPEILTVHKQCFIRLPDSLSVYVSSNVIQRAFSNLIKNAMESYLVNARKTKPGKVEVSAEKTQNGVRIVIRDYGVGLSKKALASARSFSPRTTSKKLTGSGFGLAIAYSKIKHHGGTLSIDSDGPDQGATVTIFLPSKGE